MYTCLNVIIKQYSHLAKPFLVLKNNFMSRMKIFYMNRETKEKLLISNMYKDLL